MRDRAAFGSVVHTALALAAVVVALCLAVAEAGAVAGSGELPAGSAFEVSDDDAGSALFSVTGLAPGHQATNCISIAHRLEGEGTSLALRVFAEVSGALAHDLGLSIETGTGARFGNCSSFQGSPLYVGRLDDFASMHGTAATGIATLLDGSEGVTAYRFTVWPLDTAAQASAAEATFTWAGEAAWVTAPPLTATPTSQPAPGATPKHREVATVDAPVDGDAGAPAASPVADTVPAPSPSVTTIATSRSPRSTSSPSASLEPVREEPRFGELVGAVASVVVTKGSFPILLIAIGVGFLLVQDFIDRRDPKLALAPVHAEPDVVFAEA